MKILRLSLFLFSACAALATAHAAPLKISATYGMIVNNQDVGLVKETFSRKGKTYQVRSETSAIGIFSFLSKGKILLVSRGDIGAAGLRPRHFEHHRGDDPNKAIFADFDWNKNKLSLKYDGRSETADLPAGTQDRLSLMYQFMFMPRDAKLSFPMTNGRALETYRYILVGEEKITTPIGTLQTLRYTKLRDKDDEDSTDIWLAKDKQFFPVRVLMRKKDGGQTEQIITDLEIH